MNEVAAVIINKDTLELLRGCLASLAQQDYEGGITVWVVDNGSTDGSPEMVLSEFPDVNLVWNEGNVGYARACNQGIESSAEPLMVLLNSDTLLTPDSIAAVTRCFERNPRAAVVGPRVLNPDGTVQYSCREFPSMQDAFFHAFLGLFSAQNRFSTRYKKMDWDHGRECEVDWVSGCFMALRREAVEAVGGFDEGYFMYVEDVDICWRLRRADWEVHYVPEGDVTHLVAQSSRLASTRMTYHHHRSMLRFHRKTYSGPVKPLVDAAVAVGVWARFVLIAVLNAYYRVRAVLGGATRVIMPGRQ